MQSIGAFGRVVLLAAALGLLPLGSQDLHARRSAADGSPRHGDHAAREAEKLRTGGATALAEHRLDEARQLLNESYERSPASETLYYLGQLAAAEGHVIEAQDLMRRFAHELGPSIDPQQQKEAMRIVDLPSQPYGELEVLGARNALVRVDGRLLGVLPLSLPLRVPSGAHTVQLNLGAQRLEGPVEIRTGRTAQLRFDLQTGVAVVTLPPTVLLVQDYGALQAEVQNALAGAAEQATRAEQHAVLYPIPALARAPELSGCVRTRPCQVQLLLRNEVDYAIVLALLAPPHPTGGAASPAGAAVLHGELLDGAMGGEIALALDQPVDLSAKDQAASLVGGLVTRLLVEGRKRPRGSLEIKSTPPGAVVLLPSGVTGTTPYDRPAWVGSFEVVVQKVGYKPAHLPVNVKEGQKETLQVNLEPLPGPPPRRPLWRTVTGAIAIGLGGTLILVSTPSLFSSDSGTVATGAGIVTLGTAVAVGGVLLLTLPWAKPKAPPPPPAEPVR